MSGETSVVADYLEALLDDTTRADACVDANAIVWPAEAEAPANRETDADSDSDSDSDADNPVDADPDLTGVATAAPLPMAPLPALPALAPVPGPAEIPLRAPTPHAALAPLPAPASAPAVMASAAAQSHRWIRVSVGADSYALELLRVQEVVRLSPIVAMRGAATAVLGVMNLRGRIVPVFDLGLWLNAGHVDPDARSRIVVVERDDELIGVLVSAVEDVVTLGRDRIEPPLPGCAPGALVGIARVGASPTVLLDAMALYG